MASTLPLVTREPTRTGIRFGLLMALLVALASAGWSCAHAPPVTGNRAPGAGPDPDYPEINCAVNNTVDCRPAAY